MGQIQVRGLDQLPLRTETFEECEQLKAEEDLRIDGGAPDGSVQISDPLAQVYKVAPVWKGRGPFALHILLRNGKVLVLHATYEGRVRERPLFLYRAITCIGGDGHTLFRRHT